MTLVLPTNKCEGIVHANAVCDYASACANSYPGRGNLWQNMLQYKSPADTLPKSSGPLYLGTPAEALVSSSPTFIGKPGAKGSHMLFPSAQYLFYSGVNGDAGDVGLYIDGFLKNAHKTGANKQPATVIITMHYKSIGSVQCLFSTKTVGSNAGVFGYINAAGKPGFTQYGDSAAVSVTAANAITTNTDIIIGIGWNGASIQRVWYGSATCETGSATFNPATVAPTSPLTFGLQLQPGLASGTLGLQANTKIYDILLFNSLLTNTDMAAIITMLNARNGLVFTI